jgi:hypothetical protein
MAVTPLHPEPQANNRAPMADLLALRMNDTIPFVSHGDGLNDALRQARAMIMVLETAFRPARDRQNIPPEIDKIDCLNPAIVADALDGTATLIALAQHHRNQLGA